MYVEYIHPNNCKAYGELYLYARAREFVSNDRTASTYTYTHTQYTQSSKINVRNLQQKKKTQTKIKEENKNKKKRQIELEKYRSDNESKLVVEHVVRSLWHHHIDAKRPTDSPARQRQIEKKKIERRKMILNKIENSSAQTSIHETSGDKSISKHCALLSYYCLLAAKKRQRFKKTK